MRVSIVFIATILLAVCASAQACIWDYDTLRDEQRGLPGVAEVLAGRFEKRSDFFYRDRVTRMEARLKEVPDDQAAIDNYAVALFRTGQADRAIAVLKDKEARFPEQYTTASNLATFYMLRGDAKQAIPLLEKAIRINPDAHFGRETYQLKLAHYLASPATQPAPSDLSDFLGVHWVTLPTPTSQPTTQPDPYSADFAGRLLRGRGTMQVDKQAINAIVGMIRFGTEQSPDLYLALGNQLALRGDKHLAVRAYIRAIETGHPHAAYIRALATAVAGTIHPKTSFDAQVSAFTADRTEAATWVRAYQDHADQLIRSGQNPDDESLYTAFYRSHGASAQDVSLTILEWLPREPSHRLVVIALLVLLIAVFVIRGVRRLRKRKKGGGLERR